MKTRLFIPQEILATPMATQHPAPVAMSVIEAMMEDKEATEDTTREIGFRLSIRRAIGRVVDRMTETIFQ